MSLHSGENNQQGSVALAIIAIIISITALVLAWVAYNRTGTDLEDQIDQQIEQSIDSSDEVIDDAGREAQEATDSTEEAIDNGPDGVDDGTQ